MACPHCHANHWVLPRSAWPATRNEPIHVQKILSLLKRNPWRRAWRQLLWIAGILLLIVLTGVLHVSQRMMALTDEERLAKFELRLNNVWQEIESGSWQKALHLLSASLPLIEPCHGVQPTHYRKQTVELQARLNLLMKLSHKDVESILEEAERIPKKNWLDHWDRERRGTTILLEASFQPSKEKRNLWSLPSWLWQGRSNVRWDFFSQGDEANFLGQDAEKHIRFMVLDYLSLEQPRQHEEPYWQFVVNADKSLWLEDHRFLASWQSWIQPEKMEQAVQEIKQTGDYVQVSRMWFKNLYVEYWQKLNDNSLGWRISVDQSGILVKQPSKLIFISTGR